MRKGMGFNQGRGYKNLIMKDPYIHSLNAKGVKTQFPERMDFLSVIRGRDMRKDFGTIPTPHKKGLIKELARKVVDGIDYAVEWEREHLPKQKEWVKKEFDKAKEEAQKVKRAGSKAYKTFREEVKKKDVEDVRDELDTDDNGTQDIPMSTLEKANKDILSSLDTVDKNMNEIPDYQEDDLLEMPPTQEITYSNKPIGIPVPFMFSKEAPEPPVPEPTEPIIEPLVVKKDSIFQKAGRFVRKEFELGKDYLKHKQLETRELHELNEKELLDMGVREGKPMIGSMNKYERELFRRVKEKKFVEKRLAEIQTGKEDKQEGGLGFNFDFLNPFSISKKK